MKQNFRNVTDGSIGMGLACSHAISRALGGDTMIKYSDKGLTNFLFRIPVNVTVDEQQIDQGYDSSPALISVAHTDLNKG